MLDAHNEFRNRVASGETKLPGARNMNVLTWSPELADAA
jgi:hypothetical protein